MSKADTWMPLYIPDYLRDTGHLTTAEHGAYLLLLMQAWSRGGALPVDEDRLRTLARMDRREWARARDAVLAFFVRDGDTYRNPRLDREIERATSIVAERKRAGQAGASRRWQKAEQNQQSPVANAIANGMANGSQTASQTDAPLPLQKKEPPSPPSEVRSPRGSRLPVDWRPDPDLAAFATQQGLDPQRVAAQFRDYWHAKAGKDAVKLDWPATWRGWCRREAERRPTRASPTANDRDWFAREIGARMNGAHHHHDDDHAGPLFDGQAEEIAR
jgi:uncharacterized protein YdaU (DUF1376 family)